MYELLMLKTSGKQKHMVWRANKLLKSHGVGFYSNGKTSNKNLSLGF